MRLERLVVSSSGVDVTIDMNQRVTVISLIDEFDRRRISELLVRALQNQQPRDGSTTIVDDSGTSGVMVRSDGTESSDVILHVDGLRSRCVISAPAPLEPTPGLSAELRRLALELTDVSSTVELAREELAALDNALAGSSDTAEMRRRLLEDLEPIERRIVTAAQTQAREQMTVLDDELAELGALLENLELDDAERDDRVVAAAAQSSEHAQAWRDAATDAALLRALLVEGDPSRKAELDELIALPNEVPSRLASRFQAWFQAVQACVELEAQLVDLRAKCDAVLGSSATVRTLALHDPNELYGRVEAIELAEQEVSEAMPVAPDVAEEATPEVDTSKGRLGRLRRRKEVQETSAELFSPTLQWVSATFDPEARQRAALAVDSHDELLAAWNVDFPEISPESARAHELDVRVAHARCVEDVEHFELVDETELERERTAEYRDLKAGSLQELLVPFGLAPSTDVLDEVERLVFRRERAEAVREAIEATKAERDIGVLLDQAIATVVNDVRGATQGSLETRLAAVERAAAAVVRGRSDMVPDRDALVAEYEELRAQRDDLKGLMNSTVQSIVAASDLRVAQVLLDERSLLLLELAALPEVTGFETLARRHIAAANEVRSLEAREAILRETWDQLGSRHVGSDPSTVAMEELESILRARLVAARLERLASVSGRGSFGRLPLILDDPFVDLDDEHRDRLLALVGEISADVQIVFLTEDRAVKSWARGSEFATLLEADSSAA